VGDGILVDEGYVFRAAIVLWIMALTGSVMAQPPKEAYGIRHIVVMIKENHTFDNYFNASRRRYGGQECNSNGRDRGPDS
jgi:hypothetical protein